MANTEAMKVLQVVREAKEAVNDALANSPGNPQLEKLSVILEEVETTVIFSALDEKLAELRRYQKDLEEVNARLKLEVATLQGVAEKVGRAAKAVGIFADIVSHVADLGVV